MPTPRPLAVIPLLVILALSLSLPSRLHAQQLAATRVGITHGDATVLTERNTPRLPTAVAADSTSNLGWYILGGAVIGAATAGLWSVHEASKTDDAMNFYEVPIIGIGAGLGALIGWGVGESVEHHGH